MINKAFLKDLIANPYQISNLDYHSISQIIHQAVNILKEEKLLLELDTEEKESEIIVIGDIHGHMKSLQRLIEITEQTNPKFVVFLGDIVDRGPYQLECLILILALKIQLRDKYFLLKGNHESFEINQYYGFYQEFLNRFKDKRKFEDVIALYNVLPISAILNKSVLCLHGGISEDFDILKKLRDVKTKDLDLVSRNSAKTLMQIMWNDPKSDLTGFSDSFRGPGIKNFGEDVFNEFMKKNELKSLIRSHEVFYEGFKWFFNKKLLSIFSSANYRGRNPASYAIIRYDAIIPKLLD